MSRSRRKNSLLPMNPGAGEGIALPQVPPDMTPDITAVAPVLQHQDEADSLDVCAAMFEVCRQCQEAHLDKSGAVCMFDVAGGPMPSWTFQVLKSIVEMLIADIAADGKRHPGGAVGVTVKRSGAFWALAIAENLSGSAGERRAARRLTMVQALTERLGCITRVLPNPVGSTIAIAFPADGVQSGMAPVTLH